MILPVAVDIPPTQSDMNCRIIANAFAACMGGRSNIFESVDRSKRLFSDQYIGQLGNYAASMALFGSPVPYLQAREAANEKPHAGDNGVDFLGTNIDVKTSELHDGLPVLRHRLAVRPRERHKDHIYIQALVDKTNLAVLVVGWAATDMLPDTVDASGPFKGAFTLRCEKLRQIMSIRWERCT